MDLKYFFSIRSYLSNEGQVWKRVRKITFFWSEIGVRLDNRAAHPHQEFPEAPPGPTHCLNHLYLTLYTEDLECLWRRQSHLPAASKSIEWISFGCKKGLRDFSDTGILPAKLGPLVKYLRKRLAISFGSEISWESALNVGWKPPLPLFLFRISLRTFQVPLTFDFSYRFFCS